MSATNTNGNGEPKVAGEAKAVREVSALGGIPAFFAEPDPKLIALLPKGRKYNPKDPQGVPPPTKCAKCNGWHPATWAHLDFVGHADLTLMIIAVDPEWDWRPMALTPEGLPLIKEHNGILSMWGFLKVLGKERLGVGTCDADKPDAEKELIGDLLRNIGMRFGFCTKLWSKTDKLPEYTPPQLAVVGGGAVNDAAVSAAGGASAVAAKDEEVANLSTRGQHDKLRKMWGWLAWSAIDIERFLVDVCGCDKGNIEKLTRAGADEAIATMEREVEKAMPQQPATVEQQRKFHAAARARWPKAGGKIADEDMVRDWLTKHFEIHTTKFFNVADMSKAIEMLIAEGPGK